MRRHAERIVKGEGEFLDLDFTLSRTVQHLTLAVVIHNGTAGGVEGAEKKHVEPIVEEKLDCIRKVLCFNDSGIPPKEYVEEVILPTLVLMKREVNESLERETSRFPWENEDKILRGNLLKVRKNIDQLLAIGSVLFSYDLRDADSYDIGGTLRKTKKEVEALSSPGIVVRKLKKKKRSEELTCKWVGVGKMGRTQCMVRVKGKKVSKEEELEEAEGDENEDEEKIPLQWLLRKKDEKENEERRYLELTMKHDQEVKEDDPLSKNGVDVKLVPVKLRSMLGFNYLWLEYLAPKKTGGNYYDCPFQWVKMEEREIEEGADLTERDGDWCGEYCIFEVILDEKENTFHFVRLYRDPGSGRDKAYRQPVCFDEETASLQPRSRYFSKDVVHFQFADAMSEDVGVNKEKVMREEVRDRLLKKYFQKFHRFVSDFLTPIDLDQLFTREGFEGGRQ